MDLRSQNDNAEALSRSARMLRTALGAEIVGWLDDANVVEIMLNPDGRLWLDRLTSGLEVSAVSVPLPLEWKNSLQFVATRRCTPLAQSFASD
jgi:Flp pilus assembly CpaF family ATPase